MDGTPAPSTSQTLWEPDCQPLAAAATAAAVSRQEMTFRTPGPRRYTGHSVRRAKTRQHQKELLKHLKDFVAFFSFCHRLPVPTDFSM